MVIKASYISYNTCVYVVAHLHIFIHECHECLLYLICLPFLSANKDVDEGVLDQSSEDQKHADGVPDIERFEIGHADLSGRGG